MEKNGAKSITLEHANFVWLRLLHFSRCQMLFCFVFCLVLLRIRAEKNNTLGMSECRAFVYLHFSRRERIVAHPLAGVKRDTMHVLNKYIHTFIQIASI